MLWMKDGRGTFPQLSPTRQVVPGHRHCHHHYHPHHLRYYHRHFHHFHVHLFSSACLPTVSMKQVTSRFTWAHFYPFAFTELTFTFIIIINKIILIIWNQPHQPSSFCRTCKTSLNLDLGRRQAGGSPASSWSSSSWGYHHSPCIAYNGECLNVLLAQLGRNSVGKSMKSTWDRHHYQVDMLKSPTIPVLASSS